METVEQKIIRQSNEKMQYYIECFNEIPDDILRILLEQKGWKIEED